MLDLPFMFLNTKELLFNNSYKLTTFLLLFLEILKTVLAKQTLICNDSLVPLFYVNSNSVASLVLYKNTHSLVYVHLPFLANACELFNSAKISKKFVIVIFSKIYSGDYYLDEHPTSLLCDDLLDNLSWFNNTIMLNYMTRIILPYPLNEESNGMRSFSTSEEQHRTNSELCFSIIESIYVVFYQQISNISLDERIMAKYHFGLHSIVRNATAALKVLLIFNPTIMKYLGDPNIIKTKLEKNKTINEIKQKIKDQTYSQVRDIIITGKLKKLASISSSLGYNEIDAECLDLYKNTYDLVYMVYTHLSMLTNLENNSPIQICIKNIIETSDKLKNEFVDLKNKQQILTEYVPETTTKNINYSLSVASYIYWVYSHILTYMGDVQSNICWETINNTFIETETKLGEITWTSNMWGINGYLWETARIVETNPTASRIILNYLSGRTAYFNIFNNFALNYYLFFSGLIKSICDGSPSPESMNMNVPTLELAIFRIRFEIWTIENFMNLYWAVMSKTNQNRSEIDKYINFLLKRLKHKGFRNYGDFTAANVDPEAIRILYAINILKYSPTIYKPTHEDFSTKFRTTLYFVVNLQIYIDMLKW